MRLLANELKREEARLKEQTAACLFAGGHPISF
jgi:hypothetical protein